MRADSLYRIEQLSPNDTDLMRALLNLFGAAFDDKETYCHHQPQDSYLSRLLGRDNFITLVAVREHAVVGGLTAYELHKFEQSRHEIYIYDLAVAVSARRKGVATALLNALRAIAKERGAYVIVVQADHGDTPAICLYEKLGRREEVLHFDITPDTDERKGNAR